MLAAPRVSPYVGEGLPLCCFWYEGRLNAWLTALVFGSITTTHLHTRRVPVWESWSEVICARARHIGHDLSSAP